MYEAGWRCRLDDTLRLPKNERLYILSNVEAWKLYAFLAATLCFATQCSWHCTCIIRLILPSPDWPVADDVDNCRRHITRPLKN